MSKENRHLIFDLSIGKTKPESIVNKETSCPFCDVENLEGIFEKRGSIIYLQNKYPTLYNTDQRLIIESDICDSDLSQYPKGHATELITFGIEKWLELKRRGDFASVLFYKNHGPLSGGTIAHPHMQIVGLKEVRYEENIRQDMFEGLLIHKIEEVEFNLSTHPKMGFIEFNILSGNKHSFGEMTEYIQRAIDFILNHFPFNCRSYNLFFYETDESIIAKVIPRFVASPLYIGYTIPQVPHELEPMIEMIKTVFPELK
ncbi:DUF4931 domain-containing protein [Rossellomorea aquimaris]|uniref:DUF4931 domain-containing protein n=1 Tax=Rossellomorea aquimaris TaxID=189382 RepID=UPI0007D09FF2|nr:DUF4931 domain-containing protein [Rossellomorea aquimaris]